MTKELSSVPKFPVLFPVEVGTPLKEEFKIES